MKNVVIGVRSIEADYKSEVPQCVVEVVVKWITTNKALKKVVSFKITRYPVPLKLMVHGFNKTFKVGEVFRLSFRTESGKLADHDDVFAIIINDTVHWHQVVTYSTRQIQRSKKRKAG